MTSSILASLVLEFAMIWIFCPPRNMKDPGESMAMFHFKGLEQLIAHRMMRQVVNVGNP